MKSVLITAGATMVPIDTVRGITNVFKGRTGTQIAEFFAQQGSNVVLLTSNPTISKILPNLHLNKFTTYWELYKLMHQFVCNSENKFDIIIHSAAVSDYEVDGVYVRDENSSILPLDRSQKVDSSYGELFLKLIQTPKIVDLIKREWGFDGKLVKFKLQVGISDEELIKIARKSLVTSSADFIVANCLEWSRDRAIILGNNMLEEHVKRDVLAESLWRLVL